MTHIERRRGGRRVNNARGQRRLGWNARIHIQQVTLAFFYIHKIWKQKSYQDTWKSTPPVLVTSLIGTWRITKCVARVELECSLFFLCSGFQWITVGNMFSWRVAVCPLWVGFTSLSEDDLYVALPLEIWHDFPSIDLPIIRWMIRPTYTFHVNPIMNL